MKAFIVVNREGMLQKGFVSARKAAEYVADHPGSLVDEVEVDQSLDPAEEVGPPHTISMVFGIRVVREISQLEEVELVRGFFADGLKEMFGDKTVVNPGGWEVFDAGNRRIKQGN